MYLSMYASIGVSFFLLSIFIFHPSITYHLSISNYHISINCLTLSSSVSTYPFTKMSISRCSFLALSENYFKSLLHEKIVQTSSKELAAGDHHPWWLKWFLGTQSFGAKCSFSISLTQQRIIHLAALPLWARQVRYLG